MGRAELGQPKIGQAKIGQPKIGPPKRAMRLSWSDPRFRAIVWQLVILGGIGLIASYLIYNTNRNLASRHIATGFGFLDRTAGIPIGEALIYYNPAESSYGRALVIGVLMMSEFIAPKSTIGVAQVAFDSGMAASWAVLSVALGFPLFGWLLAKKLYNTGEYTISAAIAKQYGRSTQLTVSVIMIYALLLVNVAFYVSGAAALSSAFHISLTVSAVIIAAVSSFYCAIGGQKSAAYVSLLHTTLKCLGIAVVLCVALSMTGGISPMMEKLPHYYFTWDGKIGIWVRGEGQGALAASWGVDNAVDYVRKMNARHPVLLQSTFPLAQQVAAGEILVGFGLNHSAQIPIRRGAPIKVVVADPAPISTLYSFVPAKAKNPSGGALLARWLATPEGAKAYEDATDRGNPFIPSTKTYALLHGHPISQFTAEQAPQEAAVVQRINKMIESRETQ